MAELKNLERDLDRFNTRLLVAALFVLLCFGLLGWRMVVLPRDLGGWGQLCQYITACRAHSPKGHYRATWPTPGSGALAGCEVLLLPPSCGASNA